MKDVYSVFEFDYIKEKLISYALTKIGKQKIRNLQMFDDEENLSSALENLNEGLRYCYKYSSLPIRYHDDLEEELISISKGAIGSKEFFYQVSNLIDNIKLIKQEFKEAISFPLINEYINEFKSLEIVKSKIDRVISPSLDILDSASNKLFQIRNKISHLQNSITSLTNNLIDKYRPYLSDNHGALRNGIFTLMVKSTYKNRISGITLSVSDTGSTVFIEPQELIEVYNNIASLKEEEIQEIQNILKDLSVFINNYHDDLMQNNYIMGEIDFIFAKANFAISYHGEIAKISSKKEIRLEYAAHPIIDLKKVVRNNFILDSERMMIITGPNAGGKTVALKTVGLLVLMHQCGLALPIKEGGSLPFFKKIFADIGDNQSLIDNLSTFSSHIVNIKNILEEVDENSLVIIDELGSGTSPLDGEAIGLGVIKYLLNKKCLSLLSSHYEAIKSYALECKDILCASMIYDEKEMKPTYKLLLHVASPSYGIEVAERLGLQLDVINNAKEYIVDRKNNDKDIKLEELNKTINETEKLKLLLESQKEELETLRKKLNNEIKENENIRREIISNAEVEKQKIIENAKQEIDEIFNEFKNLEQVKLHQVISAKRKIDEKAVVEEIEETADEEIQVGDIVEITSSKVKGKVKYIDNNRLSVITDAGLIIQVKKNNVRKCQVIKKTKPQVYVPDFVASMKKVSTECNVIGLTVKEAIEIIDKYLDDAIAVHYKQVRIIHGSGTGKLRTGIHQYLKKKEFVDSIRLGGQGEGGVGATIVYFK